MNSNISTTKIWLAFNVPVFNELNIVNLQTHKYYLKIIATKQNAPSNLEYIQLIPRLIEILETYFILAFKNRTMMLIKSCFLIFMATVVWLMEKNAPSITL